MHIVVTSYYENDGLSSNLCREAVCAIEALCMFVWLGQVPLLSQV
jgi:hypothetical protein